jgi:hypothetical protein
MIKEVNREIKRKEMKEDYEEERSDSFRIEDCLGRTFETTIRIYMSIRSHI